MTSKPDQYTPGAAHHRRQGHVFWLRAGATWLNQDKPRPFALAGTCADPPLATLVYGSTQRTERDAGAASIAVLPVRQGLNRNGLYATTHFYPSTLLLSDADRLPGPSGYLGRSVATLRVALRDALGIGCGSCRGTASPAGSRRGRIVVLTPLTARQFRSALAVVLTEPTYSRERRYQIIVPILPGPRGRPDKFDVLVTKADWLAAFSHAVESVVLPVSVTLSVRHAQAIAGETPYVVDDDTLAEIDRRLCDYFSLPPLG